MEMPEKWRSLVHPRRGKPVDFPVEVDPGVAEVVREMTRLAEPEIEAMLGHSATEPEMADAVRAWLRGEPDPVGAAAVACVIVERKGIEDDALRAAFVDAWTVEHGLPFAACAFTELCGVRLGFPRPEPVARRPDSAFVVTAVVGGGQGGVMRAMPDDDLARWWGEGTFMRRLRNLIATAGDDEYQETVRRLAAHRGDGPRRLAVTYLVPTERKWADECFADDHPDMSLTTHLQLFCSLSTAEHVADLNSFMLLYREERLPEILATLLHGGGRAAAPALAADLAVHYGDVEAGRREQFEALVRLPSDEALQALVERLDQKDVLPWLTAAADRFPVRAIRVLSQSTGESTAERLAIEGLLRARVHADPELARAALPALPPESRKVVEPLLPPAAVPDADDLPPLLVDPPWTRPSRGKSKPVVLDGLTAPAESSLKWEDGEFERLDDEFDWPRRGDGELAWFEKWVADNGRLTELWQLPEAAPDAPVQYGSLKLRNYDAELVRFLWLPKVVARFGVDALPLVLRTVTDRADMYGEWLLPYLDADVARTMAGWLGRFKTARDVVHRWLRRHGVAAVPYLVPLAFGKSGPVRRGAESALRVLAEEYGETAVVDAAGEAGQAVAGLFAVDPLEMLPSRMPKTDWADPERLPRVLLRGRERALPTAATRHLLTMLAISKEGKPYPGVDIVRELCDPASLAEFSWEVFLRWYGQGAPTKENWALAQLGLLGDDTTVRRLSPLVRAWPGESASARAVTGLDALARIGSDVALTHLYALSRKGKYTGIKEHAQRKVEEIAAARGLTSDQLADRAVPDFGLDAEGGMTFDYGSRRFAVGFDEQLRPFVVEENGKVRKSLPKPGPKDDPVLAPAAHTLFAGLRKDVRTVAEEEIRRLEKAMVRGRRWSPEEFRRFFVSHPLLWHIVRRLVWLAEEGDGGTATAFRIAEDRTFADVNDDVVEPSETARVGIAHPVALGESVKAWSELFADYEILQPFPQLGRPVHRLTEEERTATRLRRLEGRVAPYGKAKGMSQSRFEDCGGALVRADLNGRYVIVDISPGLMGYYMGQGDDQTVTAVRAATDPRDPVHPPGGLPLGEIDPVTMSEVIADIVHISE
ncbi:WGR and DUF4132 domain-containing protein [Actinomadura vinacea]|uniref:WGR and DUF4132 domain-containing protein n=1 Tax=Actinomadura vinacea TaxID=115336 RepID=A0ABN3JJG9_9ACTN